MTVEENIKNGKIAIELILRSHTEVKGAMERKEVGKIDFVWGKLGSESKKYKDGYGIAKILFKHGEDAVYMIPNVIVKGKYESSKYNDRAYFILGKYRAVIRFNWDNEEKTWLVTNFIDKKIKNPDDTDAFVRSVPTANDTISSLEQGSDSNIL